MIVIGYCGEMFGVRGLGGLIGFAKRKGNKRRWKVPGDGSVWGLKGRWDGVSMRMGESGVR
jgi:hypothetical protein